MTIPTSDNLMPHIEQIDDRRVLFVDGVPSTVLTVEIPWKQSVFGRYGETMSGYDYLYPAARALELNALKVPVKWSQVEPEEGRYDFSYVDHAINTARANELRLVLGWFGHYASGDGSIYRNLTTELFAPMYIVEDAERYPRAEDATGVVHHNAASYAESPIVDRECAAFAAFMRHIRDRDEGEFTVLMIQVENEIATFGLLRQERSMWRDHCEAANALFGEWGEDELSFSARLMARRWIRPLTDTGKAVYPLPFFCNFVGGKLADHIVGGSPGEDVSIYLQECPSLDFIGLNLYVENDVTVSDFRQDLDRYRIGRNMVSVTETNSDAGPVLPRLCFDAIARYASPIIAPWALNISYPTPHKPYVLSDGTPANGAEALRETYGAIAPAAAPIAAFAATDRLVAIVPPRPGKPHSGVLDLAGSEVRFSVAADGRLIVIRPSAGEFLVVGCRAGITVPTPAARWPACREVSAERGRYDGTEFVPTGEPEWFALDQTASTVSVSLSDPAVVRLRLYSASDSERPSS